MERARENIQSGMRNRREMLLREGRKKHRMKDEEEGKGARERERETIEE